MKTILYALIACDESGKCLSVVGSPHEALTKHGKMGPAMVKPCSQLLGRPGVVRVEVVKWQRDVDLDAASALLIVTRSEEHPGWLSYQVKQESGEEETDAEFRCFKDLGQQGQSEAEDRAREQRFRDE